MTRCTFPECSGEPKNEGYGCCQDVPPSATVDTAPLYRALIRAREALIPVRSGASIRTIAEIDAILNAAPNAGVAPKGEQQ